MKHKTPAAVAGPHTPAIEDELPPARTGPQWGYIILLAASVIVLGVTSTFALLHPERMAGWEYQLFHWINGAWLPSFVGSQIARPISDAVWGMVALVAVLLLTPKFRLRAWQYAVAGGSAYVLAFIIEHIIDRARPIGLDAQAIMRGVQDGPGFPSGHVSVLAALCMTVWLFVSWPWRIVLVVLVLAEAWSRLYLGVHAPLDVLGAVGVAGIVVACAHLAPRKLRSYCKLM